MKNTLKDIVIIWFKIMGLLLLTAIIVPIPVKALWYIANFMWNLI